MKKKHLNKYSLWHNSIKSAARTGVILSGLVSSIFIILINIMGCSDVPRNMLTPEDVDRYLYAPDSDTLCLTNGYDTKCVTLVPNGREPRLPVIHIYPKKVVYVFYYKGVAVIRAERPRDDVIDPPIDIIDPPIDVIDPPVDVIDPPIDIIDPPIDVIDPPVDIIDPPVDDDKEQDSGGSGVGPRDDVNGGSPDSGNNNNGNNNGNNGNNGGSNNGNNGNNNNGNNQGNNNNGNTGGTNNGNTEGTNNGNTGGTNNGNTEGSNNGNTGGSNNGNTGNSNNGNSNNGNTGNNNRRDGNTQTRSNNINPSGHNPPDNVLSHLVYGHADDNPEHKVGDGWIVWIFYPHNYVKDDNNDGIEDNPRGLGENPMHPQTGPSPGMYPYGFTFSVSGGEVKSFSQTSGGCTDTRIGPPPDESEATDNRAVGKDNRDDWDDTPCSASGSDYSTQMFVKSSAEKITLTIKWTHGMYAPITQTFNIMKEINMKDYDQEGYDPGHLNQHRWED